MRAPIYLFLAALAAFLVAALTGCASVPRTEIRFNKASGALEILSPKNVRAKNIHYRRTATTAELSIGEVRSENDPEVLGTIANANAATLDKAVGAIEKLTESAAKGAVESVVPAP